MKVYLDDEREAPSGWLRARWPKDVIDLLQTGGVTDISLDHDLGDDARGTGYDVILWLEEAVAIRGFVPPAITIHSANTSARIRMEAGVSAIKRQVANVTRRVQPPVDAAGPREEPDARQRPE